MSLDLSPGLSLDLFGCDRRVGDMAPDMPVELSHTPDPDAADGRATSRTREQRYRHRSRDTASTTRRETVLW